MSSRRDDDLVDLLDDLEYTLSDLREELQRRPEARRPLRPPSPSEILRFTDEYTIPTVISILEANIRALELLQKLLRLANPDGSAREASDTARRGVRTVRDDAVDGLDRALSELQHALSEADLPRDPESRDIIEDARSLTDEIERRIEESRSGLRSQSRARSRSRDRSRSAPRRQSSQSGGGRSQSGPVEIAVDEEPDGGRDIDDTAESTADDGGKIDVEAELQSIKDDLDDDDK